MEAIIERIDRKPRQSLYIYKVYLVAKDGKITPTAHTLKVISSSGTLYITVRTAGLTGSLQLDTKGVIKDFETWFQKSWPQLEAWIIRNSVRSLERARAILKDLEVGE